MTDHGWNFEIFHIYTYIIELLNGTLFRAYCKIRSLQRMWVFEYKVTRYQGRILFLNVYWTAQRVRNMISWLSPDRGKHSQAFAEITTFTPWVFVLFFVLHYFMQKLNIFVTSCAAPRYILQNIYYVHLYLLALKVKLRGIVPFTFRFSQIY
jgi:hypothetical protein